MMSFLLYNGPVDPAYYMARHSTRRRRQRRRTIDNDDFATFYLSKNASYLGSLVLLPSFPLRRLIHVTYTQ